MKRDYTHLFSALLILLTAVIFMQTYFLYGLKKSVDTGQQQQRLEQTKRSASNEFFNDFSPESRDPFEQIQKMQEEMQKSFGHFNSRFDDDPFFKEVFENMSISPLSNIKEEADRYLIELSIPGADESNIKIITKENYLQVSASSQKRHDENSSNYIHKERYSQHFERSFILPPDADEEKVQHHYKNGILTITIAKKVS